MRQKVIGITLLILGVYFVLINPIVSFLVHVVFNFRIDIPSNYFIFWIRALWDLWLWITILFAGLGIVFIKYGRINMLKTNSVSLERAEAQ